MELLPKVDQSPFIDLSVKVYPPGPDGSAKAVLAGVPNNPAHLVTIIQLLTAQHAKAQEQNASRLILPVRPIRNGPHGQ